MNKGIRISLICIISLLILLVIGGTIFGYVQKYAYADYNTDIVGNSEAIVNFNQIFKNSSSSTLSVSGITRTTTDYTYSITGTATATDYIWADVSNLDSTHHYYFNAYNDTIDLRVQNFNNNISSPFIYTGRTQFTYAINFINGNTYDITIKPILIDLDLMFGSDNLPTLQECQELFVANYYPYNTGTPMYNDTLQAYTNGVNAYLSTTELTMNTGDFVGSCYAVNLNSEYVGYGNYTDDTASINWSVLTKGDTYVQLSQAPNDANSTICLPFYATLKAGTQITITGYIYDGAYHQVHNIGVGYWVANNMVEIGNMTGYTGSSVRYKENVLTYTLPVDIDRIYIYCGLDGQTVNLQNFSVSYYLTDVEALKSASTKYGYEQAKSYYETYYGVDGDGYKEIYNIGKQYGLQHNDSNAWGNAWEFIQSAFTGIGSIFSIELLPNVPLSVFVLVPLMVGLIFFIIKVVKGGGS